MRAIYSNLLRVIEMQAAGPCEESTLSAAVVLSDKHESRAVDLIMKASDSEQEKTPHSCGVFGKT